MGIDRSCQAAFAPGMQGSRTRAATYLRLVTQALERPCEAVASYWPNGVTGTKASTAMPGVDDPVIGAFSWGSV
jgi:hypothetical protein